MVGGGVLEIPTEILPGAIVELGKIGLWLQALGIIIILWIGFQIISLWMTYRMKKTINQIKKDLKQIEEKINKLKKK